MKLPRFIIRLNKRGKQMIIGLDDTDSKEGMCTTYLAAVLIEKLAAFARVEGYPLLVRLNPNIIYKTRGNAGNSHRVEKKRGCRGCQEDGH
jgi:tRNA(Ile2)-agmatinylcytidine synthase